MKKATFALCLFLCLLLPADGAFSIRLLNAKNATGAGDWYTINEETASGFTWTIDVTGTPTQSTTLEGCIEETPTDCTSTKIYTLDTSTTTTTEMRHIVNKEVRHIRANVGTLSGGTVTARAFKGRKP